MLKLLGTDVAGVPLSQAVHERGLDAEDSWLVTPLSGITAGVSEKLFAGRAAAWRIAWQGAQGASAPLAQSLSLVGAVRHERFGDGVRFHYRSPPLPPGFRVLAGFPSLLGLIEHPRLQGVVRVTDPDTRNLLDSISAGDQFAPPKQPSPWLSSHVVQWGVDNLEFVRSLVGNWNRLRPDKPLSITGHHSARFVVGTWQRPAPKGTPLFSFGVVEKQLCSVADHPALELGFERRASSIAPVYSEHDHSLPQWVPVNAPNFIAMSGRRLDIFIPEGDKLEWRTTALVADGWPAELVAPVAAGPRIVTGTVSEVQSQHRVVVRLDCCPDGEGDLTAYVLTPSAGKNHTVGVHCLPYPGAKVAVMASACFGPPPVCLGEVRSRDPIEPSPSIEFEDALAIVSQAQVEIREAHGKQGRLVVKDGKVTVSGV